MATREAISFTERAVIHPVTSNEGAYLASDEFIDWRAPSVHARASELAEGCDDALAVAERCFLFVRDEIKHSGDWKLDPVTCRASDVLKYETGWCYAKSHLLAALLRANALPAGLCYQRLSVSGVGAPYCLHGLNAVKLPAIGWYRVDPRGNKPGVEAGFCPPAEQLAFQATNEEERDLPEIWPTPHPAVIRCLTTNDDCEAVLQNLPDIAVLPSV